MLQQQHWWQFDDLCAPYYAVYFLTYSDSKKNSATVTASYLETHKSANFFPIST